MISRGVCFDLFLRITAWRVEYMYGACMVYAYTHAKMLNVYQVIECASHLTMHYQLQP